jgi:hypothetical protein
METAYNLNVYPWADVTGLCPILREPAFWAGIFTKSRFRRKAVEKAARAIGLRVDLGLMESRRATKAVVAVVNTARGRQALNRALGEIDYPEISQRVLERYYDEIRRLPGLLHPVENQSFGVGSEAEMNLLLLSPIAFGKWLRTHAFDDQQRRAIAIYACVATMCSGPNPSLAEELLGFDPLFEQWVVPGPSDEEFEEYKNSEGLNMPVPEIEAANDKSQVAKHSSVIPPAAETSSEPRDASIPNLTSDHGPRRETVAALRVVPGIGQNEPQRLRRKLQDLDVQRVRVSELNQETAQLPLLGSRTWIPPHWETDIENMSLEEAVERLAVWERQLGVVHQLAERATALLERMPSAGVRTIRSKNLNEAEDELGILVGEIQGILDAQANQDREAETIFNVIEAAGDGAEFSPIEAVDPSRWKHLCALIVRPPDITGRHGELSGRWDIAGLIAAWCWQLDDGTGLELAADLVGHAVRTNNGRPITEMLAFLTPAQAQQLTATEPAVAPALCQLLIAVSIRENCMDLLDYLEPLLSAPTHHPTCGEYYRSVLDAYRRGELEHPTRQLVTLETGIPRLSLADIDAQHRRGLRAQVGRSPGMEGTYKRMRVVARNLFLKRMEGELEWASSKQLLDHWRSFGGIDDMVEACQQAIPKTEKVSDSHRHQTHRYLQTFQEELERWETEVGAARAAAADLRGIRSAWERVQKDVAPACHALASALLEVRGADMPEWLPARDFFARVTPEGSVRVDFARGPALITSRMTRAWPEAVAREEVRLPLLLHDWLREVKPPGLPALHTAVELYLQRGQFAAAIRSAARQGDPRLQEKVISEIERQRSVFRDQHAAILSEAQEAAAQDADVRESLLEVEKALDEPNLKEARSWIDILSNSVLDWRERQDPERETLIAFLREAGETPPNTRTDDLRRAAELVRATRSAQREHIAVLIEASKNEAWPPLLRESWRTLATSIDRPSLWFLDSETAAMLAEAIKAFRIYLASKWQWRSVDPDLVDALMRGFAEWLPKQVRAAVQGSRTLVDPAFQQILELEGDLTRDCPDRHVLAFLGQDLSPLTAPTILQGSGPVPLGKRVSPGETLRQIDTVQDTFGWQQYRYTLSVSWDADVSVPVANQRQIKDAVVSNDWANASRLAAAFLREHNALLPVAACGDVEAVYALARCFAENGSPDLQKVEIAALALHSANCGYYFSENRLSRLTLETTLRLAERPVTEAIGKNREELGQLLQFLRELSLLDLRQHPLGRLFSRASAVQGPKDRTASFWLARVLWRSLEGQSNTHVSRGELLFLLFRLSLYTELDALAAEFSEERWHLVVNCLRAFAYAEAHPEAQPQALNLSEALRQGKRLRPWNHLFSLIRLPSEESEPPVCELASEFLENDGLGGQLIEVRICPSLDAPESLRLQLGEEASAAVETLVHGEPLYRERVFSVTLPAALIATNDASLRVPWRLVGQSSRGYNIDVRGAWTVVRAEPTLPELPQPILHYWPGATRGPVARHEGLHGRTREIAQIRQAIFTAGRQSSVMVFGQRRIGKTSVIREISRALPPRRGELCGAFFDIAALTLPRDAGGMAESFFTFIVNELDSKENESIQNCLRSAKGLKATVAELAIGLQPQHNLLNAFERLVERLSEATGGIIERLVLFIDEFDRFVEPLLVGLASPVNTFMWNLRPVVQRAETISLILAGSGLQRLLTDNYKDALFGSIGQIPIDAFSWDEDREAVLDTFLPREVRSQLCRAGEVEEVARHAWELCGGHPMFLALLGAATAALGRGRHWTRALLRHVVEQVVERGIRAEGVQVTRGDFYGHIFDSLQRLPVRDQAVAKLLLVNLAEHTTTDFPWLETQRALAPLSLPTHINMEDCDNVLKALVKENAVTQESNRVRVTVPLTASALRRGAPELHRDAFLGLAPARS